jgi:hypothetical protein
METKFSRRQFGQAAIATTATAALSLLAGKTFAQQRPDVTILGVDLALKDAATPGRRVLLRSLNLATGQIQDLPSPNFSIDPGEQISGFTTLMSGEPFLAVTPVGGTNARNPVVLVNLTTLRTIPLPSLNRQQKVGGLVQARDGNLLVLVLKKNGRPPTKLYDVNVQTGKITDRSRIVFPSDRVATLAQHPDGRLYAALLGDRGQVTLVELDRQTRRVVDRVRLKVDNKELNNGLQGLIYSPSTNQLFAFGARRYQHPFSVYLVDQNTGDLTLGTPFPAIQIAPA